MLSDMTTLELIFMGCAILGGGLLAIRVVLMFVGGDSDGDAGDVDADVDADIDGDMDGGGGSDSSFRILSLQGLSGFFMLFGLIGIGTFRSIGASSIGTLVSIIAGIAAGLFAVWVITRIFTMMSKLQSSGTLDLANAVGQEGTVYLAIPAKGRGKVQVGIQGKLQEFEAESEEGIELGTGDRVKVVKVVSNSILSVVKA